MRSKAEHPRDPLTGLYTFDALPQLLIDLVDADADQRPELVALLIIDIDRYKSVLVDHGTAAGNYFLTEITTTLLSQLSADASLVRSGGAEFTVLLPGATGEHARQTANRLTKAVEQHATRFKDTHEDTSHEMRATITTGIVVAGTGKPDELVSLLYWIAARGYSALRKAKQYGYGRVELEYWFPPSQRNVIPHNAKG